MMSNVKQPEDYNQGLLQIMDNSEPIEFAIPEVKQTLERFRQIRNDENHSTIPSELELHLENMNEGKYYQDIYNVLIKVIDIFECHLNDLKSESKEIEELPEIYKIIEDYMQKLNDSNDVDKIETLSLKLAKLTKKMDPKLQQKIANSYPEE